jgi:predicted phage terminase large subunit-like protein
MVVGESVKDRCYYILDFVLERVSVERQVEYVIKYYERYSNLVGRITYDEKANNGFGFWARKVAREKYGISLPLVELGYGKDKFSHFEPHVVHFRSGRVLLPRNHVCIQEGINQLLLFPGGKYDDFVDGISGCLDNYQLDGIINYFDLNFYDINPTGINF